MKNNLKKIREDNKVAVSTLEKKLGITKSEIYDIENNVDNNVLINNKKLTRRICSYFQVEQWDLFPVSKKEEAITSIYIPTKKEIERVIFLDTSICMENYHFKRNFLKYFQRICLPKTVIDELNYHKDSRNLVKSDKARRALRNILEYKDFILQQFGEEIGENADDKIFSAAINYATNNPKITVFFLSGDRYHNIKKSSLSNLISITENDLYNEIEKYNDEFDKEKTKIFWKYIDNNTVNSLERMDLTNVDINGIYSNNYTPLCFAIYNRKWEIARFLLKLNNIDINVTGSNPNGYGALHCAVAANNINLIKLILNHPNVYPNLLTKETNVNNITPLMIAAAKGNEEVVKILIDAGVSVNQQDTNGETALHKAALKKHKKIYEYLKQYSDEYIIDMNYNFASEYIE